MADQTQRLEIATVKAEVGSNILYQFSNAAEDGQPISTESGEIRNLKQVIAAIQEEGAEKISVATTIFPTTAAGLAATANGGIFLVQSSDADEIYTVWKNQAGAAVNTGKTAMSSQAVQNALTESNEAAQAAEEAADVATERTAGLLQPVAIDPVVRDNGMPLELGDRYFNTEDQAEYIYKDGGWAANDSLEAIAALEQSISVAPGAGLVPRASAEGRIDEDWVPSTIARASQVSTIADALAGLKSSTIYALDNGADNTGATSASAALSASWAKVREAVNSGWTMAPTTLVIAPGVYLVDQPVDWTDAYAWNLSIEAVGAVFYCKTVDKISIELLGTRGLTCRGLSLYGDQNSMPLAGLIAGPSNSEVCGNNHFIGLKTDGYWKRTAVWNIGSETTLWDFCYFVNRYNGDDSWSYIADSFNAWGISGNFAQVRDQMVWASLTCNDFKSCRFAHHGGKSPLYRDGIFHWTFDKGSYFLTWGSATLTIRCRDNARRNVNIDIQGLYESAGASMYGGLNDCIRIICDDGVSTAIEGFEFNAGQPHAKRAIIRLETPLGVSAP